MKRAYKYRLNPTPEQIVFFNKSFGCCRFVYNYGIKEQIDGKKGRIQKPRNI